jgi:HK97 family phage major capsid protein
MRDYKKDVQNFLRLDIQFFAEDGSGEDKSGDGGAEGKDLKALLTEVKEASKGFAAKLQAQQEEIKQFGQVKDDTKNQLDEMESKYTGLVEDIKKLQRLDFSGNPGAQNLKSAGEIFTKSDQYKNMLEMGDKKSAPVQVDFFKKDLTSAASSAGELMTPDRQNQIVQQPDRQFWLRDLLAVQGTDSNSIEYVRETGFTNNAAPVAEGNLKPQSELTFTTETASVKTIAHWIPATRQAISDARQLQSYIDNRLRYGLKLEEESQILYGDGTGDNLSGLLTDPNIQDVGGVGALGAGDNMVDHLRRSLTRVILAGYPATGTALHPTNWEQIELMKADNGQYLWFNLGDAVNPRLFRTPVVQTPAMAVNDYLIGAFGLGAQLWDREQTEVRIGEPNDYFLRNMIAVLAEERLALTKYRPEAFVTGSLAAEVVTP